MPKLLNFQNKSQGFEIRSKSSEVWRPLPNFPVYEISNMGQVRSVSRTVTQISKHGKSITVKRKSVIRKQNLSKDGYPKVSLYQDNKCYTFKIHRLVAETFLGHLPGLEVNHKNLNKLDNRPENLEWVSHQENMDHAYKHGARKNTARGSKSGMSKLSEDCVLKIREMLSRGNRQIDIARQFGVSQFCISSVKLGNTWGHSV